MKALAWGANFVLVVAIGLALQGCGYKMIKEKNWLDKDEKIAGLEDHNRTASANLEKQLDMNRTLQQDLDARNNAIEDMKKQMFNLQEALIIKRANEEQIDGLTKRLGLKLGPEVSVTSTVLGTVVSVPGDILFSSGKVDIREEAKKTLDSIANEIKDENREIIVSGFTDSDPIKLSPWKTNMRLSGERAMAVMDYLTENGVPAERMHFAGYGEHRLTMSPDGTENKKGSRRVEILLMSQGAGADEAPVAPEAPAKAEAPQK